MNTKRKVNETEFKEMIQEGMSLSDIAQYFEIAPAYARQLAVKYGLVSKKIRTPRRKPEPLIIVRPKISFEAFEETLSQKISIQDICKMFDIKQDTARYWADCVNTGVYPEGLAPVPVVPVKISPDNNKQEIIDIIREDIKNIISINDIKNIHGIAKRLDIIMRNI